MAAPALIRVKRFRDESPLEALVVSCKKQKFSKERTLSTVLTFAGTVKTQEENVQSQLSQALKEAASKGSFKSHVPNVREKVREQVRSQWQKDRFKVVNFYRFQGENGGSTENNVTIKELTVVDIESQTKEVCGDSGDIEGIVSDEFEYDLYYTESAADLAPGVMDGILSVHPYELVSESYRDEEMGDDYSDDSNDENNWRNDYPEERSDDEEEGVQHRLKKDDSDDDLLKEMAKCGIGSGEELSDDEDDEALVYGRSESPFDDYRRRCRKTLGEDSSDEDSEEYFSGLDDQVDSD